MLQAVFLFLAAFPGICQLITWVLFRIMQRVERSEVGVLPHQKYVARERPAVIENGKSCRLRHRLRKASRAASGDGTPSLPAKSHSRVPEERRGCRPAWAGWESENGDSEGHRPHESCEPDRSRRSRTSRTPGRWYRWNSHDSRAVRLLGFGGPQRCSFVTPVSGRDNPSAGSVPSRSVGTHGP